MIPYLILLVPGLALGWAVNVLADDLPLRRRPRAVRCSACGQEYRLAFGVALVHFALRGGRCGNCGARRMLRHLAVELASVGVLWFLWPRHASPAEFALAALVVETFLLITVIDLEHRLILHVVSLPAAVLAGVVGVLNPRHSAIDTLLGGAVGYGVFFLLYFLGDLLSRVIGRLRGEEIGEVALGGGDVNLAGVVGLLVGYPGVLLALMITVLSGGLAAFIFLVYKVLRRTYSPFMAIPYGPFLVMGGLALYLFSPEILAWTQGR